MVTANMLLSVFFLSGALADCQQQTALLISAPKIMEALNGSCLQIPCNFSIQSEKEFNSQRTTFGVWMKSSIDFANNPNDVIFNSSQRINIYPMNITGNLSQRDCTTLFSILVRDYTDTYYFRIENSPFLATANCDQLQITVNDSPPRPRIEISGDLREKQSVTITCSASTPCPRFPPELTWNLQLHPRTSTEENTDRTFTRKIQETITLTDQHDGLNVSCSARYPVNEGQDVKTAEETTTLNVSYAPKNTSVSISPSDWVSAGSWVNLSCSSRAKPPVSSFSWFKNSKHVSDGYFYSFNVTDGGVYYCVATNALGNETSPEIHLTIKGSSQLGPILGEIIGIVVLICLTVCVWWLKSTHPTAQQTQSQTGEDLTVEEPASKTEEDIHYGEIDFSKWRPEASSEQDSGQQQDTLYAQVKVSNTANRLTQTADGPEDLYAVVKKQ